MVPARTVAGVVPIPVAEDPQEPFSGEKNLKTRMLPSSPATARPSLVGGTGRSWWNDLAQVALQIALVDPEQEEGLCRFIRKEFDWEARESCDYRDRDWIKPF